jgi:hypothetical protein
MFLDLTPGAFLDIQYQASSIVLAYRLSYFFPE